MYLVLKKVVNWWQAKIDGNLNSQVFKTKAELLDHYMVHHIVEDTQPIAELSIDPEDETFTKILKVAVKNGCHLFGAKPLNIEVVEPFIYKIFYTKGSELVSVNDLLIPEAGFLEWLIGKSWLETDWYKISEALSFMRWLIYMASPYGWIILLFVKLYETQDRVSFINTLYCWPLKF